MAATAALGNLVLAAVLFEKALGATQPQKWQELRRTVNTRDVRLAVQAYIQRRGRANRSIEINEPDPSTIIPDQLEGSADEAVQDLLGEAQRAMAQNRLRDFNRAIDSITELVSYAMNEIEKANIQWAAPGSYPHWPPARELGSSLYSFRRQIVREGRTDYLEGLFRLEDWLVTTAIHRGCGELFTASVEGYRWNWQIGNQYADAAQKRRLLARLSDTANNLFLVFNYDQVGTYVHQIVELQERMLSDAMHSNLREDYQQMHNRFAASLGNYLRWRWTNNAEATPDSEMMFDQVAQRYRIALMGLAGRAVLLESQGRLDNTDTYLNVARHEYSSTRQLGQDTSKAIDMRFQTSVRLWADWDGEHTPSGQVHSLAIHQYPLAFFTVHILELAYDQGADTLDLHGRASQVSAWFKDHVDSIGHVAALNPGRTLQESRELATQLLNDAEKRDTIAQEQDIIGRDLSCERLGEFRSEVYAAATSWHAVEQIFDQAGALLLVPSDATEAPEERYFERAVPKAHFMNPSNTDRVSYSTVPGRQWGQGVARDAIERLREALEQSPEFSARMDTTKEFVEAITDAEQRLCPSSEMIIVLTGDWSALEIALNTEKPEDYQPGCQLPEYEQPWRIGKFRSHSILRLPGGVGEKAFICEPAKWGCFIKAQFVDGQELRIEVIPVSEEMAKEYLKAQLERLPNETFDESKVRTIRTNAIVHVGVRHKFLIKDSTRGLRIVRPKMADEQAAPTVQVDYVREDLTEDF